jgi:tetratricopeptide (TPR) repeat protein
MRTCLATLLGLSLGLPPVAVAAVPEVGPGRASVLGGPGFASALPLLRLTAPEADKPPEVLYEEGKKAYRLGKFADAVAKWEEAYDKSERPLLLYNISLAYKSLYGISGDVEDLRKARAVMKNFLVIAQADPDVEADDAEERITELDGLIAQAEVSVPKDDPDPVEPEPEEPKPITPSGPDPGRTLRIAGASTLGVGGLFVVTGSVLGIYYGVRGQEFSDELRQLQADRGSVCDDDPDGTACRQQDANIETARNNGRTANLGLGLALGIGGGLGLVALSAGAILFVQGNRRTAEWKRTVFVKDLRLVPTGRGLAVHGRF